MKQNPLRNHLFYWLTNRTICNKRRKKARNIKEKRHRDFSNTVSKPLVALRSSANDKFDLIRKFIKTPENIDFLGFFFVFFSVHQPQQR